MESDVVPRRPDTLVIHVSPDGGGELVGLIQHVSTGEKRRFHGLPALDSAIRELVRREPDAGTTPAIRPTSA